jgi:hypothetical protein
MFDVGLVGALAVYLAGVAWRAVWGAAPGGPIRFAVVAGVSAAIHLGFHAAATAAPSIASAVALVLAGWTSFGLWCAWLSRAPGPRHRMRDDDGGEDGGDDGGRGPGDDPSDPGGGPPGDGPELDWETFERDFAAYVVLAEERERARRGVRQQQPLDRLDVRPDGRARVEEGRLVDVEDVERHHAEGCPEDVLGSD